MSFLNSLIKTLMSETGVAFIFLILLSIFLIRNRSKLKVQKILFFKIKKFLKFTKFKFPIIYMILYKTKWGIEAMDTIAKKHPFLVKTFAFSSIYLGILGMFLIISLLAYSLINFFITPTSVAGVAIAQPFVKTSFGSPFFYIPFSYFIIAIFIIATIHEFSHGIVARYFKVKIKSSGFAFFAILIPILPAAFVEPNDEQVKKLKTKQQMAIYAAGPMSNIFLAVLFGLILFISIIGMGGVTDTNVLILNYTAYSGEDIDGMYPTERANVSLGNKLLKLDDVYINSISDFVNFMENSKSGQEIVLTTNTTSYNLVLDSHPQNPENGYLGLIAFESSEYIPEFKEKFSFWIPALEWFLGLLVILFLFNLGVGLMNLAPIGGLDGGQIVLAFLRTKYKEKEALSIWAKVSMFTLILLLANIFLPMIMGFLS